MLTGQAQRGPIVALIRLNGRSAITALQESLAHIPFLPVGWGKYPVTVWFRNFILKAFHLFVNSFSISHQTYKINKRVDAYQAAL
jgi:hypothetical protein